MNDLVARGKALELMAEEPCVFNWPGRLVARTTPKGNGAAIAYAILDDEQSPPSFSIERALTEGWPEFRYWRVYLEARVVAYRWWDRWHWRIDRLYVYSLSEADRDAFFGFCNSDLWRRKPA